jgi:hypothetical protein
MKYDIYLTHLINQNYLEFVDKQDYQGYNDNYDDYIYNSRRIKTITVYLADLYLRSDSSLEEEIIRKMNIKKLFYAM